MSSDDATIFALSSGAPPAGIAVMRVSGAAAGDVLRRLAGPLPPPRRAAVRTLRHGGEVLDRALMLWLPGPGTVTGEDMAELHLHGGRAVVAAVEAALADIPLLRPAQAGEFTRRGVLNGRMDLTAAEGLADLIAAETEAQRRGALAVQGGGLARLFEDWRLRLLAIAATVEAGLDFADEAEAGDLVFPVDPVTTLLNDIVAFLDRPPAERLRDGVRVVLTGPVNAGKSTLLNALVGRDAAIVTPIAGTTRDVLEVPVAIDGRPFLFIDTAGLRVTNDPIEAEGVARARRAIAGADIVLALGPSDEAFPDTAARIEICAKIDLLKTVGAGLRVSSFTGEGLQALREALLAAADDLLPRAGELALNARHRRMWTAVAQDLQLALVESDIVVQAEYIRRAQTAVRANGSARGMEDLFDTIFGSLCLGK